MKTADYRRTARALREHRVALRHHNNLVDAMRKHGPRPGEHALVRVACKAFARQLAHAQTLYDVSFDPTF